MTYKLSSPSTRQFTSGNMSYNTFLCLAHACHSKRAPGEKLVPRAPPSTGALDSRGRGGNKVSRMCHPMLESHLGGNHWEMGGLSMQTIFVFLCKHSGRRSKNLLQLPLKKKKKKSDGLVNRRVCERVYECVCVCMWCVFAYLVRICVCELGTPPSSFLLLLSLFPVCLLYCSHKTLHF